MPKGLLLMKIKDYIVSYVDYPVHDSLFLYSNGSYSDLINKKFQSLNKIRFLYFL